ncbi:uncharacterized protein LOC111040140 [Myzus persicae]|uniref:uncharacterized protein LOC111040140 n=1 Tax=Myzus persicae TaxID=13164 RepID=UPI000B93033A|nr:uncharacterized protein LOC111040140 [Myzus persicae]
MEYAQAMFEAEVLCKVFVKIANVCHVINITIYSMIFACPLIQLDFKVSEIYFFPIPELSLEHIVKDIYLSELRMLFITFTFICHIQKVYERDVPIFQDKRIILIRCLLSNITTYYFFSILYAVFKGDIICKCHPELRILQALVCT